MYPLCRLVLVACFCAASVFAGPPERLTFGKQVNASQCDPSGGKLVVNVVQRIVNTVDSGFGGNNWAFDDLTRQIQVWQMSANTFCAVLKYHGSWVTIAGRSPMNLTDISAGITGTFEGGYQSTLFTATLKDAPLLPVRGNLGTFDYQCDVLGSCPGNFFWAEKYFDNIANFDLAWWGWVYHGGANGQWVNAIDPTAGPGSSGDIHN